MLAAIIILRLGSIQRDFPRFITHYPLIRAFSSSPISQNVYLDLKFLTSFEIEQSKQICAFNKYFFGVD